MTKIAFFLKEDFHAFMPALLTNLVNDAKLDIDIKMESADNSKNTEDKSTAITFKMKGFEGN